MIKNYIKIAFRNIGKRKGYSLINIGGLGIGIAAAILISLYAINELTYDSFHENSDDIYMVYKERITPTGTQDTYDTWVPLKIELEETYPNVIGAARTFTQDVWMEAEGKKFREEVVYTDPELFEMFSFPLKNSIETSFPSLQSIVISEEIAQKYFGNENPVGKVFRLAYERDYVVSGVLKEIPQNSSIQIGMAIQLESAGSYEDVKENWGSSFLETYIQLEESSTPSELEAQFPAFITKIWDEETAGRTNFKLLPVTEMYNRFNDSDKYSYILLGIAIAIILIACINFMNMATARSLERVREVGMRKALGGQRSQLILQFLSESTLIVFISLLVGVCIAELILPAFNNLYDLQLSLNILENVQALSILAAGGILLGLISGSYPAFFLSKFSSSEVLRGHFSKKPGGFTLRRVLVTTQFAVTIVIIISTLVIRDQVQFMKNADLGLQKENIIAIERSADDFEDAEQATLRLNTFKEEIRNHRNVVSVASSRAMPGQQFSFNSFLFARPEGWTDESPLRMRWTVVDHEFFSLYDIDLIEGRSFREGAETDMENGVIINRAALEDFGWETAVGKTVGLGSSGNDMRSVVGVVENYNYQSLENEVAPILHFYSPSDSGSQDVISVRIAESDVNATLAYIESEWQDIVAAEMPINYVFVDQQFEQMYETQDRLVAVAGSFSILAIVIAALGLLGLASLMVKQRTQEIGIRKVLGASIAEIILLISRNYMLLVIAGFIVAVPIAWILMSNWIQDFAYRVDLRTGVFLIGGMAAFLIALITVTAQAFKAAMLNPAESLRSE